MKVSVECKDRKEAAAIKAAMTDPETRAIVIFTGMLKLQPTDESRQRVLRTVLAYFGEWRAAK